jgi:hypothetical protein
MLLAQRAREFGVMAARANRTPSTCPTCNATMTDLIEVGPAAPKPGLFTICWRCDEFLRFGKGLHLRTLTADDKRTLDTNPTIVAALDQLRIQIVVSRSKQ